MSVSSHTKTSVWSFPFIVIERLRKKKWRQNNHRLTPSCTHKRTLHMCPAVSEPSQPHRFTGCRVKEYVIWRHTCSDLHSRLSFKTLKENKENAKKWRVHKVKILHLWCVSVWTVCSPHPRWDLSNPCFIISACFRTSSDLGSGFVPNSDRDI